MSKNIEQQNDMQSYSEVEDKHLKNNNLHLDYSSYSKTFNNLDTKDNFNNELVKTNILCETSQLNETECKYLVNICNKSNFEFADLNSQDEKLITKITEKNLKHICTLTTGKLEINTQQFINLNIQKATLLLQQPQLNLNICKNQSIEHLNPVDSIVISPHVPNEPRHFQKNVVLTNDKLKILDKDPKLSNQELVSKLSKEEEDPKLIKQDQHPEIINFRAMCKAIIQIGVTDNNVKHDNINSTVIIKDKLKQITFEQVNTDELKCINYKDCLPSTSKSKFGDYYSSHDNLKQGIACKRHQSLSSDDSSDNLNELSQYKCWSKKVKYTKKINKKPINSNLYSDKIIQQSNSSNKINLIVLTSSEDEEDKLIKNYKFKINDHLIEKNNILKKVEPIFRCSPNGIIHAEMLNSIHTKNCIKNT